MKIFKITNNDKYATEFIIVKGTSEKNAFKKAFDSKLLIGLKNQYTIEEITDDILLYYVC